jgi:hypothetical protein
MNVKKALKIFGLQTLEGLNDGILKVKYRKLMKKHHPDLGGSEEKAREINEAFEVLKKVLEKVKSFDFMGSGNGGVGRKEGKREYVCLIHFDDLFRIYDGYGIMLGNEKGSLILDRSGLNIHRVILAVGVSIIYKGRRIDVSDFVVYNLRDEYTVTCAIQDNDVNNPSEIEIHAYGKVIKTTIDSRTLTARFRFNYGIKLVAHIERVCDNG